MSPSGTHQDSGLWWCETASGTALDNNGNTTTKSDSNGTTSYGWDYENRLTSVTLPGDGGVVTFKYDPFGRRIQKSSASATVYYSYDGANIVAEINSLGNVVASYAQGPGIDQPLAMSRAAVTSYYYSDGLSSITSLANTTSPISATYSYTAFGNSAGSAGDLINPFRYTGREWDSETGLYYYRARYYDPQTGRFMTEDPIRFEGGLNFYLYVGSNPIIRNDPGGLQWPRLPFDDLDDNGLPRRPRKPDFIQCQCTFGTYCGVTFAVEVDSQGRGYGGGGIGCGIPRGTSCSLTQNWIHTPNGRPATPQENYAFNTGLSYSAGGGFIVGGQVSSSPGSHMTATGTGLSTPGGGVSGTVSYTFTQIANAVHTFVSNVAAAMPWGKE